MRNFDNLAAAPFSNDTKAMEADHAYRARVPEQGFYRLYMAHNHHMKTFAATLLRAIHAIGPPVRPHLAAMSPRVSASVPSRSKR